MRPLLVTSNLGGIDPHFPLPEVEGLDSLYFTDRPMDPHVRATWTKVVIVPEASNPRLAAKFHKCQVHRLREAQGYTHIIWADASVHFHSLDFMLDKLEELGTDGSRVAMVPHPVRNNAAAEYEYVLDQLHRRNPYLTSRYDADKLELERAHFSKYHDLRTVPLWCGGLWAIAPVGKTAAAFDIWWWVVLNFSILDQAALGPSLVESGVEVLPIKVDLYHNPHFTRVHHQ